MEPTYIELSEDEFEQHFHLLPNHLNPNAGWNHDGDAGSLFETYGDELAFVRSQPVQHLWTLVDGDDGDLFIVSGYHIVNRIGHFVSREPVPEMATIEIRIVMNHDPE